MLVGEDNRGGFITLQGDEIIHALDMFEASAFLTKAIEGKRRYYPDRKIKDSDNRTLFGIRLVGLASVTSRVESGKLEVSENAQKLAVGLNSILKQMGIEPPPTPLEVVA